MGARAGSPPAYTGRSDEHEGNWTMSFDYSVLAFDPNGKPIGACDHSISFERYVVDVNDFRTLHYLGNPAIKMRAPINGFTTVQMWISEQPVKESDPTYGWQITKDTDRLDSL